MSKGPWKPFGTFTRVPLTKEVEIGGFKLRVYSFKWLVYSVNRSPYTVFTWEKSGILPKPILSLKNCYVSHWRVARWYSAAEIIGYAEIVHTYIPRGKNHVFTDNS